MKEFFWGKHVIPNWKFFELRKRHSKFTNRILLWLLKSCPKQTANQNKGSNSKTDLGVIKFLNMLLFWPEAICLSDTVKSVRLFSRRCLTCICGIFIFLLFAFSLLSFWGFSKKILYLSDSDFSMHIHKWYEPCPIIIEKQFGSL